MLSPLVIAFSIVAIYAFVVFYPIIRRGYFRKTSRPNCSNCKHCDWDIDLLWCNKYSFLIKKRNKICDDWTEIPD